MTIQQTFLNSTDELHLISSFIAAVLSIEIVVVFVTRNRSNKGGSVAWIRVFVIYALALAIVHVLQVVLLLTLGDDALVYEYTYKINLLVVDIETLFLFRAIDCFDRFKRGIPHISVLLAISTCFVIFVIHIIELASAGTITILPRITNAVLAIQTVAIPAAVAVVLLYRSDLFIRNHYRVILLGLLLAGIGKGLYMYFVGEPFLFFGYSPNIYSIVSSSLIIAGSSLFIVALYMLPYIEDLYWRQALVAILILDTKTNEVIFNQDLRRSPTTSVPARESSSLLEEALIGGLSGIDDFVTSLIESPQGKLEYIDKGGLKLLLSWRKDYLFLLVVNAYFPIMKSKLDMLNDRFCKVSGEAYGKLVLDPSRMERVRTIVESIFITHKGGERRVVS